MTVLFSFILTSGWGGYPSQVQPGGYPCQGGGIPLYRTTDGVLDSTQYASCVHAGGLSSSLCKIMQFRSVISASLPLESAPAKTSSLCHKKTGQNCLAAPITDFFEFRSSSSKESWIHYEQYSFTRRTKNWIFSSSTIGKIPQETTWKRFKILDHFIVPRQKGHLYFLMTRFGIFRNQDV